MGQAHLVAEIVQEKQDTSGQGEDLESAEVVRVEVGGAVNRIRNTSWTFKKGGGMNTNLVTAGDTEVERGYGGPQVKGGQAALRRKAGRRSQAVIVNVVVATQLSLTHLRRQSSPISSSPWPLWPSLSSSSPRGRSRCHRIRELTPVAVLM